jgi:hypothetical protein
MDVELKELSSTLLPAGTVVEVLNRFIPQWSRGFEVVSGDDAGYVVRRLSDARVLPTSFRAWEVRPIGRA